MKLRVKYDASSNITFRGSEDVELPDGWEDYTPIQQGKLIDEMVEEYLWQLVDIYAEVVEDDAPDEDGWY